jgi:hypothetical protein
MSGRSNATDCGVLKQVERLEVVADLFKFSILGSRWNAMELVDVRKVECD